MFFIKKNELLKKRHQEIKKKIKEKIKEKNREFIEENKKLIEINRLNNEKIINYNALQKPFRLKSNYNSIIPLHLYTY